MRLIGLLIGTLALSTLAVAPARAAQSADERLYEQLAKLSPAAPSAYVTSAPMLGWADAMVINKNAPLAEKHPFPPESIEIVPVGIVPKEVVDRLQGWWSE